MESDFLSWLITQGGIGLLAFMALYLLDRSYKTMMREREDVMQRRFMQAQYGDFSSTQTKPNLCSYCGSKVDGDHCAACGAPSH